MKIGIKNMVCPRCIKVVQDELISIGLRPTHVGLGYAEIEDVIVSLEDIRSALEKQGFELINDDDSQTVEHIKNFVLSYVRHMDSHPSSNLSSLLSATVGKDYSMLSSLFSKTTSITIERYQILQKIEFVKELLVYNELTASQIAAKLDYSSPAHLSRQFKDVTGMTISDFKKLQNPKRKSLDEIG